jgi:hypothetical protein
VLIKIFSQNLPQEIFWGNFSKNGIVLGEFSWRGDILRGETYAGKHSTEELSGGEINFLLRKSQISRKYLKNNQKLNKKTCFSN